MHIDDFIVSALLVLVATSIAVALFKHLGLGSVLGLLVAGIVVGPYSPGPQVTTQVDEVRHFAELGVVLLLFLIGLEMRPRRLWGMRREVLGLGSLQIILTGIAIGVYASFYSAWPVALLVGLTFALSSTAFVLQILQERGQIASPHGNAAFSILLMQDLAIVPLLAAVPILSDTGPLSAEVALWQQLAIVLGVMGLIVGFGRYVVPFALRHLAQQGNKEGFLLVAMLAVVLSAWGMHKSGVSMALGAFIMGMLLSGSRYRLQLQASLEPFKGILLGLFFVAVGMSIDFGALAEQPRLFVQHTLVIVAIKLVVLFVLALAFGYSRNLAARISLHLAQCGEFGFVLFGSAKALNVIDDAMFVVGIGVISVTMLLTPVLVRLSDVIAKREARIHGAHRPPLPAARTEAPTPRVVIGGYGRVGHSVAMLLQGSDIPFIAFDTNPARVAQGRADGLPVYFGDVGDAELLAAAQVEHASLVVLTIDHAPTALRAVTHIRDSFPRVPVIARARDLEACGHLMAAGATHAYPEALESSLRLGRLALEMVNIPAENVELLLQGVRSDNYRLVQRDSGKEH
ncbi:MAG: portal protein [Gammaproteobacteria bacterium SG8_47]|nr:MAG: portal protein [Gammaproteobacteria bacterium SG8_47]